MRSDDPRFIEKWGWLPRDEGGNPIFSDDGILLGEYLKDLITTERPHRVRESAYPQAPRPFVWLLALALGVIGGCAIQELAKLF